MPHLAPKQSGQASQCISNEAQRCLLIIPLDHPEVAVPDPHAARLRGCIASKAQKCTTSVTCLMTQRLHCQMFTLFLSYAMECHLIKHRGSRTAVSKPEPRQPALMFAVVFPARRSAEFPRGIERLLRRGVARLFLSYFDIPSALCTSSRTQTSILGATHVET